MVSQDSLQHDLDLRTLAENFYLQALDQLSRANIDEPSLLPGWTRKHVAVHMINNAEALMNLTDWARTGVEHRMYPSREARDADIDDGVAHIPSGDIRAMSHEVAREIAQDFASVTPEQWEVEVINGQGAQMKARGAIWARTREAFVHAVDLAIGMTALDYPAEVTDRILGDIITSWEANRTPAHYVLNLTDREGEARVVQSGDTSAADFPSSPVEVTGQAGEVLQYLMGRGWPVSVRTDSTKGGAGEETTPLDLPAPPKWI